MAEKTFRPMLTYADEAHRARRRNPTRDPDKHKADANYLLRFITDISLKTRSMLLATATPVQVNTIEAFDLIHALAMPTKKVMGDIYSEWIQKPQTMLDMVCGRIPAPESEIKMWNIIRNPLPPKTTRSFKINTLRDQLDVPDDVYVVDADMYQGLRASKKDKVRALYTTDDFVLNYNPYIRHIVRRTRKYLEDTINPATGESYLKKIDVHLHGESENEAILLQGYQRQAYEKAQEFCNLLSKRVKAGGFLSMLMLKRIGSTILAGKNTARKMLAWTEEGRQILEDEFDANFEDDDFEEDDSEVKELTADEIECLHELVKYLDMDKNDDPKYNAVLDIVTKGIDDTPAWKDMGCIIFSQYYDSVHFVAEALSNDIKDCTVGLYAGGDKSGLFLNGVYTKCTKEDIKAKVRNREIKLLVGTDAASEGLNLQTLSTLINLDLPWRKGRIQRIGQISDKIHIYNMRYKDSVEDKVHSVLSERLEDIFDMFGQIPDTLEDVWIDIALNNEAQAKERINAIPATNPFTLKHEAMPLKTEDWESCEIVLDKQDKMKQLMKGW